jgi:hypothetical protein
MQDSKKNKKPISFSSGKTIAVIVSIFVFIVALPCLNILPDGTSDFSGIERVAAVKAIEFRRGTNGPGFSRPILRVVDVVQVSPNGFCNEGLNNEGSGSGGKARYSVVIEQTYLLGFSRNQGSIHVCEY